MKHRNLERVAFNSRNEIRANMLGEHASEENNDSMKHGTASGNFGSSIYLHIPLQSEGEKKLLYKPRQLMLCDLDCGFQKTTSRKSMSKGRNRVENVP